MIMDDCHEIIAPTPRVAQPDGGLSGQQLPGDPFHAIQIGDHPADKAFYRRIARSRISGKGQIFSPGPVRHLDCAGQIAAHLERSGAIEMSIAACCVKGFRQHRQPIPAIGQNGGGIDSVVVGDTAQDVIFSQQSLCLNGGKVEAMDQRVNLVRQQRQFFQVEARRMGKPGLDQQQIG